MNEMAHFLAQHGYWLVFGWVFTEQIGLPVPSTIVLVAAGTLAGRGVLSLPVVIWVGIAAALITDVIWYRIGRAKGLGVLSFLCRISLEPDSCVRRAEEAFARNRTRTLVIAKFVPGLSLAAPPLAGMFGMSFFRFLMLDLLGSLLWVGSFCVLGYVFSHQFERLYLWIPCVMGWTWPRTPYVCRALCRSNRKSWPDGIARSPGTGRSSSIALDRMRPRAPGWRSF
ncbi:MAG: DedA family protein [Acidobacteriota bacterium]